MEKARVRTRVLEFSTFFFDGFPNAMLSDMISYGVIVGGDGCIADLVFFICYPNLEW